MARTIEQVQQEIISAVKGDPRLSGLNATSTTAIWRLWTYVVAVAAWVLENLFDLHRTEVTGIIDNQKAHGLAWYARMAKAFQYGYELAPGEDFYDNMGLTEEEVTQSKIIDYAAVTEQDNFLRVKVAKLANGDLTPLSPGEKAAFTEYMERVKDAGIRLVIDSLPPDALRLKLQVFYNPLVLAGDGSRLDGTVTNPVGDAIDSYLRDLPFNGVLVLAYLVDALQAVEGVVIPHLQLAEAKYGDFPFTAFPVSYLPDSGYLRVMDGDYQVSFIPQTAI